MEPFLFGKIFLDHLKQLPGFGNTSDGLLSNGLKTASTLLGIMDLVVIFAMVMAIICFGYAMMKYGASKKRDTKDGVAKTPDDIRKEKLGFKNALIGLAIDIGVFIFIPLIIQMIMYFVTKNISIANETFSFLENLILII